MRSMSRLSFFALLSLSALHLHAQCGVERWSIKTGTDSGASSINLGTYISSTIYNFYQTDFGITVLRVRERARAVAASSASARVLGVAVGQPVMEVHRVAVTFNAAPHRRSGIPAAGADIASPLCPAAEVSRTAAGEWSMDNGMLRVNVDGRGLLTSVQDLTAMGRSWS